MRLAIVAFVTAFFAFAPAFGAAIISDPAVFVKSVYANIPKGENPPEDIYSPRLAGLFALAQKEGSPDEVGRLDFDFWANAQDFDFSGVKISESAVEGAKDRKIIVAKFKNFKKPTEIHFYFERVNGAWLLDDVRSAAGEQWTLSLILKYGWDSAAP